MVSAVALVGLGICCFALYVEHEATTKTDYTAPCDMSEGMSCSKVFTSKWGRGYGLVGPLLGEDSPLNLPNAAYGLLFYVALLIKELVLPPLAIFRLLAFAVRFFHPTREKCSEGKEKRRRRKEKRREEK